MTFEEFFRGLHVLREWLVRMGNAAIAVELEQRQQSDSLPVPATPEPPAKGTPTPSRLTPEKLQELYDTRVTPAHVLTIEEDRAWADDNGLSVKVVAGLRKNKPDPTLHKEEPQPKTRK